MPRDPYPDKELLTPKEVMRLLSMEKTAFYGFLKEQGTAFPLPVFLGPNRTHKRYKKAQILAWIDLLQHQPEEAAAAPPNDHGRRNRGHEGRE